MIYKVFVEKKKEFDGATSKVKDDIKNLLLFLATKYTDTDEEFDEIERLVKMEGGMIQNTVKQMKRIYGEKL